MTNGPQRRKPGRPKAAEANSTMEQILQTAAGLFMEQGFEKVSLDHVAQACGITKASVYYYFNNKSVLFTECLLLVLRTAHFHTKRILEGAGTLQERMLLVARKQMRNAHIEFETMMREANDSLTEEQIQKIRAGEQAIHQEMAVKFQEAMNAGEIVQRDPLLLAYIFSAMLTVRNRQDLASDEHISDQSVDEIVNMLWQGLSPRES